MQSQLPPARHLIGIKCHLSYKGLHEQEPNYQEGSLSSKITNHTPTWEWEHDRGSNVMWSLRIAKTCSVCLPLLLAPQASGDLFQHTIWPWVTLLVILYFLWFVIVGYWGNPVSVEAIGRVFLYESWILNNLNSFPVIGSCPKRTKIHSLLVVAIQMSHHFLSQVSHPGFYLVDTSLSRPWSPIWFLCGPHWNTHYSTNTVQTLSGGCHYLQIRDQYQFLPMILMVKTLEKKVLMALGGI